MQNALDFQERVIFSLRALYDRYGYRRYKMSKFEEYDLYARNKDFLISDSVITFTDTDGKLMALKPDVTLSIVKNSKDIPGVVQKLYYDENVYRVSKNSHAFREIMQVGLECLGDIDEYCICEVLTLAAKSLECIGVRSVLDISHLGVLTQLLDGVGLPREVRTDLFKAMGEKNSHELMAICREAGVAQEDIQLLTQLLSLSGTVQQVLPKVQALLAGKEIPAMEQFVRVLSALADTAENLRVDFSVVDDVHYYNGIVFKGFLEGIPNSVLTGGQYDKLMKKMGRSAGAIGFAVYTDDLERLGDVRDENDVDTVLLYEKGMSLSAISRRVAALTREGRSVLALTGLPEGIRCRQVLRLEAKDDA